MVKVHEKITKKGNKMKPIWQKTVFGAILLFVLAAFILIIFTQNQYQDLKVQFDQYVTKQDAAIQTLTSDFYMRNDSVPSCINFGGKNIWLDEVTREKVWEKMLKFKSERWRWPILNYRMEKYSFVFDSLRSLGAPDDFKYVSIQESFLSPRAVSWTKAKGFWQFVVRTAKKFGIKINWYIDERFDPAIATIAAVKFLNYLYDAFSGDWKLTIAAYNSGEGVIWQSIRIAGNDNYFGGLVLPKETQEYFINILAWKLIMEQDQAFVERFQAKINFEIPTVEVKVKLLRPFKIASILPVFDDSYEVFRELNPVFIRNIVPVGGHTLRIPRRNIVIFKELMLKKKINFDYIQKNSDNLNDQTSG